MSIWDQLEMRNVGRESIVKQKYLTDFYNSWQLWNIVKIKAGCFYAIAEILFIISKTFQIHFGEVIEVKCKKKKKERKKERKKDEKMLLGIALLHY